VSPPTSLATVEAGAKVLAPRWLVPEDDHAIRRVLALYAQHEGRARRELDDALSRPEPIPAGAVSRVLSPRKQELVQAALDRHLRSSVESALAPRALREAFFVERARSNLSRPELARVLCERVGLPVTDLDHALFADLPAERVVAFDGPAPTIESIRAEGNRILVEQLFARSREVELRMWAGARAVVRTAQLRGLLVVARREEKPPPSQLSFAPMLGEGPARACTVLTISGPFALFRHTRLYVSATRSLVPVLARARFDARVRIPGPVSDWTFRIGSDDPFVAAFTGSAPTFDSKVEEAFAKRFPRVAPEWELQREPEPIPLGDRLMFPDFRFVDRRRPERTAWLEIVGFWTPEYLRNKLAALREAELENLVLAVSDRLAVSEGDIPDDAHVLRFKGRVDPRMVRACLEALP
jgi:predicted nuclease of restriction endonuclease-like RecB superfamily